MQGGIFSCYVALPEATPSRFVCASFLGGQMCSALILRSMSRGGTPTDNPIIEALNGWIKNELYLDFDLTHAKNVPELLNQYVYYFNNQRLHAALGYKSPVQYKTELGFF